MKRIVTITVEVDPTEYEETEDSDRGVIDLVIDMIQGDADFPKRYTICSGGVTRDIKQIKHTNDSE